MKDIPGPRPKDIGNIVGREPHGLRGLARSEGLRGIRGVSGQSSDSFPLQIPQASAGDIPPAGVPREFNTPDLPTVPSERNDLPAMITGSDRTTGEVSSEHRKIFTTTDQRLTALQEELGADPEKKAEIAELFAKPLGDHQGEIVAVRSYDVATIVNHLRNGRIPIGSEEDRMFGKGEAREWFYLTPVFGNEFYNDKPDIVGDTSVQSFAQTVGESSRTYAPEIAFSTAFAKNVAPVLEDGWKEQVFADLKRDFPDMFNDPAYSLDEGIGREQFITYLRAEAEQMRQRKTPIERILQTPSGKTDYPLLSSIAQFVPEETNKRDVLKFLADVNQTRGGVVVGFNADILQGRYISHATDATGDVIHSDPELAVEITNGYVDLSHAVVAIEALGEYEDGVLTELGLQST